MLKTKSKRDASSLSRLHQTVANHASRVVFQPGVWYPLYILTRAHVRLLMRHERVNAHHMSLGDIAGSVKEGTGVLRHVAVEMYRHGDEDARQNFSSFASVQDETSKAYSDWLGNPSASAELANKKHWVVTSYGGGENGAWTIRRKKEDEYLDASGFAKAIGPVKPAKARDYTHWKAGLEHMLEMWNLHREGSLYPDKGPSSNDNGGDSDRLLDEAWAQDCAHSITHVKFANGHIGLKVVPRRPVVWSVKLKKYVPTNERTIWVRVKEGKVKRTEEDIAKGVLPGRAKLTFYRRMKGGIHEFSIVENEGINLNSRYDIELLRAKRARAPLPFVSREDFREVYKLPLAPQLVEEFYPRLQDRRTNLFAQGMLRGPITCSRAGEEWEWNWSRDEGYHRIKANGDVVYLDKDIERKLKRSVLEVVERTVQGCDLHHPQWAQVWREEVQPGKFRVDALRRKRWVSTFKGEPIVQVYCNFCKLVSECVPDNRDQRHLQQEHSKGRFPIKGTTGNLRCLRCGAAAQEKSLKFRVCTILGRGVDNVQWTVDIDVFGSTFMRYLLGRHAGIIKAWGSWYRTPRDERPEEQLGQES